MSEDAVFVNGSLFDGDHSICIMTRPGLFGYCAFNVTYIILLLPLCIFILFFGFQQIRKKSSTYSMISHCDSFTYHMVIMEMIAIPGNIVSFSGNCMGNTNIFRIGMKIFCLALYGQMYFHILTCVERYLAVVHPITYLGLRNERGIKYRNMIIVCVWLLCFLGVIVGTIDKSIFLDVCLLIAATITISFCSLSVLYVLIHPGPGQGKGRERVGQSKRRAFYTIIVILGILMVRLLLSLVWVSLDMSGFKVQCIMMLCSVWVNLPNSLVLPLLFLQRKVSKKQDSLLMKLFGKVLKFSFRKQQEHFTDPVHVTSHHSRESPSP